MTPGTSQDGCEGRRVQSAQLPEEVEHRPPAGEGEGGGDRPTDRGEGVTDPPSFSPLSLPLSPGVAALTPFQTPHAFF